MDKEENVETNAAGHQTANERHAKAIAERARLSMGEVFTVESGGYSSEKVAQQVVTAFNQLSGMQVALSDIQVYLVSRQNIVHYAERHRL